MYFLLSGEGPTDMGLCADGATVCEANSHQEGPMAIIVSRIVEGQWNFSFLETGHYGYVSKKRLVERASEFKQQKKSPRLPGIGTRKETAFFYKNARALALCAKDKEAELQEEVVAVLFRDSDGTASAGRGLWKDKRQSMVDGFEDEEFRRGVPMIPKPKSEAWIICAVKENPYQGCAALEDRSGSDNSPNSLKGELAEILGSWPTSVELCDMVNNQLIDIERIDMPSFTAFRDALKAAVGLE